MNSKDAWGNSTDAPQQPIKQIKKSEWRALKTGAAWLCFVPEIKAVMPQFAAASRTGKSLLQQVFCLVQRIVIEIKNGTLRQRFARLRFVLRHNAACQHTNERK